MLVAEIFVLGFTLCYQKPILRKIRSAVAT